jgi:hypothetical protein
VADTWTIRGVEFQNCNCNWGCPCQFGSPSTHGHCETIAIGHIEEGHFNETKLDGLNWALVLQWPGEVVDGNGCEQAIIDERADADQREALRKILYGESTAPAATHFYVYNSTMSTVLGPVYASIESSIDVDARTADIKIGDLVESKGRPLISRSTGEPVRSLISLPRPSDPRSTAGGFHYTFTDVGNGNSKVRTGIELDLKDSHGQFTVLHMSQDGMIR